MKKIELRPLGIADEEQARIAAEEFDADFDFLLGVHGLTWENYLVKLSDEAAGRHLPAGYVPATFLGAFVGDDLVGRVSIRHYLNDFLLRSGGHIGYGVRPRFRKRGMPQKFLPAHLSSRIR